MNNRADYTEFITAVREEKADLLLQNARVLNLFTKEVLPSDVAVWKGRITAVRPSITPAEGCTVLDLEGAYLSPGLIDAHVHIESSMQTPAGFASVALPCGTTSVIADPHEIVNVAGAEGMRWFLEQAQNLPLRIYTMMPSCVPCTPFENNGFAFTSEQMEEFSTDCRVLGLGEVMNPGAVVACEDEMISKLLLSYGKQSIDGHAPLLSGPELAAYSSAGIQTDHECSTYKEILERLRLGMKAMIRVGSAANDVELILRQIVETGLPTENLMVCTDDKHTEDIRREGHINHILRLAVKAGIDPLDAVRMGSLNAARHYRLPNTGAVAPGYFADLAAFRDLQEFEVTQVIAGGKPLVIQDQTAVFPSFPYPKTPEALQNTVHYAPLTSAQLQISVPDGRMSYPVMELRPHQLLTKLSFCPIPRLDSRFYPSGEFCKIAVVERHHATGNVGVGIIKGFGIQNGAIASTVAHDSHNIVAVGDNDADILAAIAALKEIGGGYAAASGGTVIGTLPLPLFGLITDAPVTETQNRQRHLIELAHQLGVPHYYDPFISLSFLALPVIPEVRITDLGMFDVVHGKFLR